MHRQLALLTTTSKSALVQPRKYSLAFGFFPFLSSPLFKGSHLQVLYHNDSHKTHPLQNNPSATTVTREKVKATNSGPVLGKQDLSGCLKRRRIGQAVTISSQRLYSVLMSVLRTHNLVLCSYQKPPPKLKMQKWSEGHHSGQTWGRMKELGREAGSSQPATHLPGSLGASSVKPSAQTT